MKRQVIWALFFFCVAFFSIWFVITASSALLAYTRASAQAPATVTTWEYKETGRNHYVIIAHYQFDFQGVRYQNRSVIGNSYPNPWAAQTAIDQLSQQSFKAWFNPSNPKTSILDKKFPLKKTLSAVLLIGLLIYFSLLAFYLHMRQRNG